MRGAVRAPTGQGGGIRAGRQPGTARTLPAAPWRPRAARAWQAFTPAIRGAFQLAGGAVTRGCSQKPLPPWGAITTRPENAAPSLPPTPEHAFDPLRASEGRSRAANGPSEHRPLPRSAIPLAVCAVRDCGLLQWLQWRRAGWPRSGGSRRGPCALRPPRPLSRQNPGTQTGTQGTHPPLPTPTMMARSEPFSGLQLPSMTGPAPPAPRSPSRTAMHHGERAQGYPMRSSR